MELSPFRSIGGISVSQDNTILAHLHHCIQCKILSVLKNVQSVGQGCERVGVEYTRGLSLHLQSIAF